MRLTENEREVLVEEVLKLDPKAEVWLHGSRVDDSKRGGDIDLLIVSDSLAWNAKVDLAVAFAARLGEQKIDVHVCARSQLNSDPFARRALATAVKLA